MENISGVNKWLSCDTINTKNKPVNMRKIIESVKSEVKLRTKLLKNNSFVLNRPN